MTRTTYDPVVPDGSRADREHAQETFGRHLVEQRNRMTALVRKWIETDAKFPIPIFEPLLERVKHLEPSVREDIASISLLMADEIVSAVLATFDGGDEMRVGDKAVNYAIVAQYRFPASDEVVTAVDVNRGKPPIAIWSRYKAWLSRFAPSQLRPRGKTAKAVEKTNELPTP